MINKLKNLMEYLNKKGLPIPILRDSTGLPSVSLTLLVLSSVFVILGLLSLSIPELQINFFEALCWHITSAVLYYNRGAKISKDGIEITNNDNTPKGE